MAPEPPESEDYRPPPHQLATWLVLGVAVVIVIGLFGVRTKHNPDSSRDYPSRTLAADVAPVLLQSPEMDDEYLPCSDCHEDEPTNFTRRELEDDHEDRSAEFSHGDLWCLNCHDVDDRDQLRLSDGSPVGFDESWRLCTQCHGNKLADWRAGVHGKRTGHWWGPKEYRTCVVCHDPHDPPFEGIKPKPVPLRPEHITVQGNDPEPRGEDSHHDES
jgi:hypothetical protein